MPREETPRSPAGGTGGGTMSPTRITPVCAFLLAACTGIASLDQPTEPPPPEAPKLAAWQTGARRLSRIEYDNALKDLLGDTTRSGFTTLPEDNYTPFDNDLAT